MGVIPGDGSRFLPSRTKFKPHKNRVQSNDNVTEEEWFSHLKMLPRGWWREDGGRFDGKKMKGTYPVVEAVGMWAGSVASAVHMSTASKDGLWQDGGREIQGEIDILRLPRQRARQGKKGINGLVNAAPELSRIGLLP